MRIKMVQCTIFDRHVRKLQIKQMSNGVNYLKGKCMTENIAMDSTELDGTDEANLKTELNSIDQAIEYFQTEIEAQEKVVRLGKMWNKMAATEEFNTLIKVGYTQEEADRLAQGLTNPTIRDQKIIDAMFKKLDGIREFNKYIENFIGDINQAPGLIEQYKKDVEQNTEYRRQITASAAKE